MLIRLFQNLLISPRSIWRPASVFQRQLVQSTNKRWTVDNVVQHLAKAQTTRVIVLAGAGISTPSGIPDFRSPGTGLYDNLQQYNLPYAEAIFDIEYFHQNPKPFFALAKELYPPGKYQPNAVHYFCSLLNKKGKLLRMYTQNIDGLERQSGLPEVKLVESHGNFYSAHCTSCQRPQDPHITKKKIFDDQIPLCEDQQCKGVVKPSIVFFGERMPDKFMLHTDDLPTADTLIVMGTSLEVEPFASLSHMVDCDTVPRILVNREPVRSFVCSDNDMDVLLLGDLEENVKMLVKKLGWTKDLDDLMKLSTNRFTS